MKQILLAALLLLGVALDARAQETRTEAPSFQSAAGDVQQRLADSLQELSALRARLAEEKLPLSRRLSELNSELTEVKAQLQETTRRLDGRTLDLSNMQSELESRRDEASYLSSLLGEYVRNFESGLHIAEVQRYQDALDAAKLAAENRALSEQQVFQAQLALVNTSVERLYDALGGTKFEGTAVVADGTVEHGTYAMLGPAAIFSRPDGSSVGTAEQRLGSLEPTMVPFGEETDAAAARQLVAQGSGSFPLDPTLGNAHKMEETHETFVEHVKKGGPVMIPIFAMAAIALLVALYKWLSLVFLPRPSRKQVDALLTAVGEGDVPVATERADKLPGPLGRMLRAGVEHIEEPRQLIEEVMYETVLTTRLKLQSWLPFIAICAASAPLLGLLGTVTGIINTFKLITVFGSGDVRSLSGGISEALITTKFGLIVAIPSLLLHAYLSRKARSQMNQMEKAAIAFMNQVAKMRPEHWGHRPAEASDEPSEKHASAELRAQVEEVLGEILARKTATGLESRAGVPAPGGES